MFSTVRDPLGVDDGRAADGNDSRSAFPIVIGDFASGIAAARPRLHHSPMPTPRLSAPTLERALRACARIVGEEWVLAGEVDRDAYLDAYAPGDGREHRPA